MGENPTNPSRERPTEWADAGSGVASTVDVTAVLAGKAAGERGPRTTCTACERSLEAGDRVAVEAIGRADWGDWELWSVKCVGCSSGEVVMAYGWFDQVLGRATLVRVDDAATGSAYHALSTVSFVDHVPEGEGHYVDSAAFPDHVRTRLER